MARPDLMRSTDGNERLRAVEREEQEIPPAEVLCLMDEFNGRPPLLHHIFSSCLIRVSGIEAQLRDLTRNNVRGEDAPSVAMWSCGWPLWVVRDKLHMGS
jgi:hypothetical protein